MKVILQHKWLNNSCNKHGYRENETLPAFNFVVFVFNVFYYQTAKREKNNQLADWKNEQNDSQLIYRTLDNTKK